MRKATALILFALVASLALTRAHCEVLPDDATLRREVARMLLVGFRGNAIDDSSDAARYVRDLGVGGVILFDIDLTGSAKRGSRNITSPAQLKQLTAKLQSYASEPLIIATDQEGGMVCRLKVQYGFKPTVDALHLGTVDNRDTTMMHATSIASELAEHGINLNLAPLLDVHRPDCPPIGHFKRSFSDNVDVIARNAGWTIDAHHNCGVLCTVKHFPGHGNATNDSHYGLVDVTANWTTRELEPFEKLIKQGKVDAVMTAHIFNTKLDSEYPATLSRKTLTGILREKMGFDGVIVTDDLYMEGIINQYSIERALALTINAGADLICVGNNINTGYDSERPFKLVDEIVKQVKNGNIPYQRIVEANRHISELKKKL